MKSAGLVAATVATLTSPRLLAQELSPRPLTIWCIAFQSHG